MTQTRLTEGYCIDTSALIDLWRRYYPRDIFESLWDDLEKLVNAGHLVAPREVLEEIKKQDDDLLKWSKDHRDMFEKLTEDQVQTVKNILKDHPRLVDQEKTSPEADPFLIAQAKCRDWAVITSEQSRSNPNAPPKIPDVCENYDVGCYDLIQFFREEEWQY